MLLGKFVRLRPLEEVDLPLLVQWRNEPAIWLHFFNKLPLSIGGQKSFYKKLLEDDSRILFGIELLKTNNIIGTIGFDRIDFINQLAEYGNLLLGDHKFRKRGFAVEATSLLLDYGFRRLNLNRIYLQVLSDNEAAVQTYRRCGFKDEGILRKAFFDEGHFKDVLFMGLLRDEFLALANQSTS